MTDKDISQELRRVALLSTAIRLRVLASRGIKPRAYLREAIRLENEAKGMKELQS